MFFFKELLYLFIYWVKGKFMTYFKPNYLYVNKFFLYDAQCSGAKRLFFL